MSYCAIILFKNGVASTEIEYRNAWGGAAYIWNRLFDRYLKDSIRPYDSWISRGDDGAALWALADKTDIAECDRVLLVSTFDRSIIRRDHFTRFVHDLRKFVRAYPPRGQTVCHLEAWARTIETLDRVVQAIGFHGTSVSDNLWLEYNEANDETVPYSLASRTDHFEVYDRLDGVSTS